MAYLVLLLEVVYNANLQNYLYLSAIYINMLFLELPWWEIVAFVIEFGVFVYLQYFTNWIRKSSISITISNI